MAETLEPTLTASAIRNIENFTQTPLLHDACITKCTRYAGHRPPFFQRSGPVSIPGPVSLAVMVEGALQSR